MIYADVKYVNSTLAWRFSLEQVFTWAPSAYWTRIKIGWRRIRLHKSWCAFLWEANSDKQAIHAGKTENRRVGLYEGQHHHHHHHHRHCYCCLPVNALHVYTLYFLSRVSALISFRDHLMFASLVTLTYLFSTLTMFRCLPFHLFSLANPLFSHLQTPSIHTPMQPSSIHPIHLVTHRPNQPILSIQPIPYLLPTLFITCAPHPLSWVYLYCYMSLILLLPPSSPVLIYLLPIHSLLSLLPY